jgi:L-aminopeptidase/D-esterase-like protein
MKPESERIMITTIPGMRVGHYTDPKAATGCTVILTPPKTVGSCELRGSAPGSRETQLLNPERTMEQVNAILLTGGSAFGLAAADGVMQYLAERNIGHETPWALVPIVPAAVLYDLNVGDGSIRPSAQDGYAACVAATDDDVPRGSVGAGTGATVGKWMGMDYLMKGGVGIAGIRSNDLIVSALAVVNSIGDVYDEHNTIIAGARHPRGGFWMEVEPDVRTAPQTRPLDTNTTLVVIATNASLTKMEVYRMCQRGNTGMARAIKPVHTLHDGDCVFGLATGGVQVQFDIVAELAAETVAAAIRDSVRSATSVASIPALS